MEAQSIYYEDAKKSISQLFDEEFPDFPEKDFNRLLNSFYQLSNYEEEGMKVRPFIYISNNIHYLSKNIPDCSKIAMYQMERCSNNA